MKIHANTAQKVAAQLAAEGFIQIVAGIGSVVPELPSRRNGRAGLLSGEIEQLAPAQGKDGR